MVDPLMPTTTALMHYDMACGQAYGRRGDVDVSAFGVDGEALDKKIAEIYAQVEEKYKDAYP